MTDVEVVHNPAQHRFEVALDGHTAVAEYEQSGDTIVFTHTVVPPQFRGQGIAERLVRTALEYAREQQAKVVPQCWYVARFIERNDEYQDLLA